MAARPSTGVRLHIVTGKGGTGKTTVAAAMAMALAAGGHRVLLVEVEERQGISQTFDVPPLATDEVRIVGGELRNEVGGTTDLAQWFPVTDIGQLERVPSLDTALGLYRTAPAAGILR